jgi:hypothetical protein
MARNPEQAQWVVNGMFLAKRVASYSHYFSKSYARRHGIKYVMPDKLIGII